jgi:peptide methionine sulfoxide reductase MsrA
MNTNTKEIYLAGGCFWGTEHFFKQIEGVVETEVGFANGHTDHLSRIDKQHGLHTIEWAEKIGLGSRKYHIVSIDK